MKRMEVGRHILALATGVIGGLIPNQRSNIHPMLMGAILSILLTKIIQGDQDRGYSWTLSDLGFLVIVGGEGALGAQVSRRFLI